MTPTPVRAVPGAVDGLPQALGACADEAGAACECVHAYLPDAGSPRAQQRVVELLATLDQAFDRLASSLVESARLAADQADQAEAAGDRALDLTVFDVRDLRDSRR